MKILIVEDDEFTVKALTSVLSHQNYAVEVATDGQAGWELAEAFAYDLILLDVMLPKLDGISLCRRLRSQGNRIPILLLSVRDSSYDKVIGLDAGADDYVVKPFDRQELVARIRALLRRGSSTELPVLEWGSIRLDPSTCEVTYGTRHLQLTPKEYSLLELLLRNSRRVFSSDAILDNLWSFEKTPGEEAVRTQIKGLRQKLKTAGAPADFIETVYGIGYRLKPLKATTVLTPEAGEQTRQQTLAAMCCERVGAWHQEMERTPEGLVSEPSTKDERPPLLVVDTEPLTRVSNCLKLTQALDRFFCLAKRYSQPLCLAILDLDHFKQLNDRYSHAAGDAVLRQLEQLLLQSLRGEDVVDRWGGEGFVLGMYGMNKSNGVQRLAKVLETLRQEKFLAPNHAKFRVTFSAGVAQYPEDGADLQSLYESADAALYQVKVAGCDRVLPAGVLRPELSVAKH